MTEEQRLELREILNYKYNDRELDIYKRKISRLLWTFRRFLY
jgi:hypothetical protein